MLPNWMKEDGTGPEIAFAIGSDARRFEKLLGEARDLIVGDGE